MSALEPCPSCHRHVKVDESSCPFCDRALGDALANRAPRAMPQRRLGRAAMFAFGVGAALAQTGCAEHETIGSNDGGTDAALSDASHPDGAAPDASSPDAAQPDASQPDAAQPDSGAPWEDDGGGIPIYAAAPTPDNGSRVAIRLPSDPKRTKA